MLRTEVVSGSQGVDVPWSRLVGRAQQFKAQVRKAEGHLRRLGNVDDAERFVWFKLTMLLFKQSHAEGDIPIKIFAKYNNENMVYSPCDW